MGRTRWHPFASKIRERGRGLWLTTAAVAIWWTTSKIQAESAHNAQDGSLSLPNVGDGLAFSYDDIFGGSTDAVRRQAERVSFGTKSPAVTTGLGQNSKAEKALILPVVEYLFWMLLVGDVSKLIGTLKRAGEFNSALSDRPLTWSGNSLLTFVAKQCCQPHTPATISLLLHYGVDWTASDMLAGETALMRFSAKNFLPFIAFVTHQPPHWKHKNLEATSATGRTALSFSVAAHALEATKLLIEGGASVDHRDARGNAPLHLAVIDRNLIVVQMLLNAGAQSVVLNRALADPLLLAFNLEDRDLIYTLTGAATYNEGIQRHREMVKGRFTRIGDAFFLRLRQSVILRLLEPEFAMGDGRLCLLRDPGGHNMVSMAIVGRYDTVLGQLLDHFRLSHVHRRPMWQQCNVHEVSPDGIFPMEFFLRSDGIMRSNGTLLRKLLAATAPVDGTSALIQAIRYKGPELVLDNLIPYGDPNVELQDLRLDTYEVGVETWEHNAVTLTSKLLGVAGRGVSKRLLQLMAVGVIGRLPDASEAFIKSLSTAAKLRDENLIRAIAEQASSAVQQWYCRFLTITADEAKDAQFLTEALPPTFPTFSDRIPCKPLVHHVQLVLRQVRQGYIPRFDVVEALSRPPHSRFNRASHVREALRAVGASKVWTAEQPHLPLERSMEELGLGGRNYRLKLETLRLELERDLQAKFRRSSLNSSEATLFLPWTRYIKLSSMI